MTRIQLTFTNNNDFDVILYSVGPSSALEIRQGEVAPRTLSSFSVDVPIGTEWRVKTAGTGVVVDAYKTTSDSIQAHLIRDCRTELQFTNKTASPVFLSSIDPVTKKESSEGSMAPGASTMLVQPMGVLFPDTEWRIKDAAGATISTYFTTTARYQSFEITPPVVVIPDITTGVTISGPLPETPSATPTSTRTPDTPIGVRSARDSILSSRSFNIDVADLEISIRERAGLTDKNQIRAAVYAALMGVARTQNRTAKEQALMDWLALQVKQTRIEAARAALAEYDRWHRDPWSYQPPGGYDFPAYVLPPAGSPLWLASTPNPPVLANESWQSFLADIVSTGGWSPLNNPIFTKGRRPTSLEGVVGFPVFGAALAYQRLYGTDEGARTFADATEQLNTRSFELAPLTPPVAAAVAGAAAEARRLGGWLATVRTIWMQELAPFSYRNGIDALKVLTRRAGRAAGAPTQRSMASLSTQQLRTVLRETASGELLSSLVCTVVLTLALQALIGEIFALDTKIRLRGQLVDELAKQQAAPAPNLGNLLYYDLRGEVALVGPDYQPTDPSELERLTGSREVYRAFLLATIE